MKQLFKKQKVVSVRNGDSTSGGMKKMLKNEKGAKNYFPLPNAIYSLGLCPGEITVYGYLVRCEDKTTYQCWPSYKTIGKAVGMSENTVRKYVGMLEEKSLILTETTSVFTKDGLKRNGNLLYTILPIRQALDAYYERQLCQLDAATERQRVAAILGKQTGGEELANEG